MSLPDDDDLDIDGGWPDEDSKPTLVPPQPSTVRRPQATLTDEAELERARALSLPSEFPAPSGSEIHRKSLLTLANEASNAPPPTPSTEALDLVEEHGSPLATPMPLPTPPQPDSYDPVAEMHDRFSLGDYSGSLVIAESLLGDDPLHVVAKKYADNCRSILEQMYTARLGSLDRVPFVAVPLEQLRWLSIDHRAGFVLSHVDGVSTLEQILDVSGMPLLDTLRILYELVQHRVVAFR